MLNFNALLQTVALDPANVRLVRHRDPSFQQKVYEDALCCHPRFEQYQSGQDNPRVTALLSSAEVLASFVVGPGGDTVFVGLWRILGVRSGYHADPYRGPIPSPANTSVVFDMKRMDQLGEYCGRVIIDWGAGERAWVQYAARRDKPILEIRKQAVEIRFPGFAHLRCKLDEINDSPSSWQEPLRATRGVYLLVHRATGQQYVGSATGADGFLGRWQSYANGHGGNVGMRDLKGSAEDYDVCILETVGSTAEANDVYVLETRWKEKLGCRVYGLNRN